MEAAAVPKGVYRDSSDVASASQSSGRWTVAQILTPVLVAFFLCLAFILYILYKRGSLSRLALLPFMRGVRRVRRHRGWEVDGGGGDFPHARDAEATPMISQPHHWNSFFPRNTTDRQRLTSRIRQGMATPSITTAIRSIGRLFGRGPVRVSRVPMPATFDIESSDSETDPFDTLRSNASRAKLRPFTNPKQNAASGSDPAASSYTTLTRDSDGTRDSPTFDVDLDGDRLFDQGITNGVGRSNAADDHDNMGDRVMLITRDGEDFSSGSTPISMRGGLPEADQSSLEVVPPTPTQPFRVGAYHARSASTPHLPSLSDSPLLHSFSPSTGDLTRPRLPRSSQLSPQFAPGNRSHPTGKDGSPAHHFTAAAPPTDPTEKQSHRPTDIALPLTISLHTPLNQRTHHRRGASSPPLSPHLQNYMPSFPGRSPPGSPYALPNSIPSSPISPSDLRNLIPSAVRGAGYNPFQHGRSASDLGPQMMLS
ncbi:hypothetical protein EI94DRAFT_1797298 [Lactarius quietus]|nr:hypothetical protein EI94DRAFT_1797298 [Lactarius quietus]